MTLRSLFFFDDWCLARRDNITRRLGQPEWVRDATYADPTENPFSYPTVLYDDQRKLWRMFYLGRETMPGAVYRKDEWFLTAESKDGIHWQRPDLTATVPSALAYASPRDLRPAAHGHRRLDLPR